MMSILRDRLSANVSFLFTEHPFLDRFAAAADAGFTAAEFLFPYAFSEDELARRIEASGLRIELFNAPPGDWERGERGIAALTGREREFEASITRALAYARRLGVPRLHVMAGIADRTDRLACSTYRHNLALAALRGEENGIEILIEPINRNDMPGYFLDDFSAAATFVRDIPAPWLGLQFDIYHCARIEGDVLARLDELLPMIAHLQIAGVTGRHEPAEPELPLRAIFQLLDERAFPGRVGCEYHPAGTTLEGLAWIDALEVARA